MARCSTAGEVLPECDPALGRTRETWRSQSEPIVSWPAPTLGVDRSEEPRIVQ